MKLYSRSCLLKTTFLTSLIAIMYYPNTTIAAECAGKTVAQCADVLASRLDELQYKERILQERSLAAETNYEELKKKVDRMTDVTKCTTKTINDRGPMRPNWTTGLQCDASSYVRGIEFTHDPGRDATFQEAVRITCCPLKD